VVTNLLIVLLNGFIVVTGLAISWLAAAIGLVIAVQFARWEIAFDNQLRRGMDGTEELL
jgi:hypothetical protein